MSTSDWEQRLSRRFDDARTYVMTCADPPWSTSWDDGYDRYLRGDLTKIEAFALCNPVFWKDQISHAVEDVLEGRFDNDLPAENCEAEELFGYECPVLLPALEQDHKFPFSRGGMTHPTNRLVLCQFHNGVKGHDVHLYPWEEEEMPNWVEILLTKIANAPRA